MPANIHQYPDFSIKLIPFVCKIISGTIELKEHATYMWLDQKDLLDFDGAEADIIYYRLFAVDELI